MTDFVTIPEEFRFYNIWKSDKIVRQSIFAFICENSN